jgi:hypothetical protein
MMSLRHGWGWLSPQTASPIHKTNTKSLSTLICCPLAYSFCLRSYTHTTFGSDWGFWARGSETDVITLCLRLTATSNCFSHPYWTYTKSLSTSICSPLAYCSSLLTQLYPHSLAQISGFWVTFNTKSCHYVMVEADSHLKLIASSILDIYKCSIGIWYISLIQLYPHYLAQIWGFWVTCGVKMMSLDYFMVETDSHLK